MAQDAAARCAAKGSQPGAKAPDPTRSVSSSSGSIRFARMAKQRKKFDEIYLQLKCRQVQRASRALGQPKGLESASCACSTCVVVCLSHSTSHSLSPSCLLAEWVYLKFNYAAHAPLNNSTKKSSGRQRDMPEKTIDYEIPCRLHWVSEVPNKLIYSMFKQLFLLCITLEGISECNSATRRWIIIIFMQRIACCTCSSSPRLLFMLHMYVHWIVFRIDCVCFGLTKWLSLYRNCSSILTCNRANRKRNSCD